MGFLKVFCLWPMVTGYRLVCGPGLLLAEILAADMQFSALDAVQDRSEITPIYIGDLYTEGKRRHK